eukprot:1280728-Rhodomonas_salina.1
MGRRSEGAGPMRSAKEQTTRSGQRWVYTISGAEACIEDTTSHRQFRCQYRDRTARAEADCTHLLPQPVHEHHAGSTMRPCQHFQA